MRIECPSCHFSAEVNPAQIPATGANAKCPRCSLVFFFSPTEPGTSNDKPATVICPKCGAEQDAAENCARCGIFYSKYRPAEARRLVAADADATRESGKHVSNQLSFAPDDDLSSSKAKSNDRFYTHVTFVLGCMSLLLLLICAFGMLLNDAYNSSNDDINSATKGWLIITPALFMLYPLEVKYGKRFSILILTIYPIAIFALRSQFFAIAILMFLWPLIILPIRKRFT